jgi:hypothetical protein
LNLGRNDNQGKEQSKVVCQDKHSLLFFLLWNISSFLTIRNQEFRNILQKLFNPIIFRVELIEDCLDASSWSLSFLSSFFFFLILVSTLSLVPVASAFSLAFHDHHRCPCLQRAAAEMV